MGEQREVSDRKNGGDGDRRKEHDVSQERSASKMAFWMCRRFSA